MADLANNVCSPAGPLASARGLLTSAPSPCP